MAKTLWTTSGGSPGVQFDSNITRYISCAVTGLAPQLSANEAFTKITQRAGGILRSMLVNVTENVLAVDTTIRTRLNGANGGMTIVVLSAQTGQFTDSSGSDTVADGDTINYQAVVPVDDIFLYLIVSIISTTFAATTDTVTRYAGVDFSDMSDGSINYIGLSQDANAGTSHTTEEWHRFDTNAAAVYKNLYVYVSINAGTSATPIFLRKNGANTTVTVSCTALTTGIFEDQFSITGNSDTGAANDDYNYSVVTNNLDVFTVKVISIEATSTDKTSHSILDALQSLGAMGAGGTNWFCVGGGAQRQGVNEGFYKNKMAMKATTSNMGLYVVTNTIVA